MFKVLIADKFPESKQPELKSLGLEVSYQPELDAKTLVDAIRDTQILFVRSTKVTSEAISAGADLMLIVRVGSGVNTIDVAHASQRGIYVANCPGKNAIAVAELALGLVIAIDRRIPQATQSLKEGQWNKKEFSKADGLKGKRFGIAGFGRIGRAVATRAKGFEMHVAAWDKFLTPEKAQEAGVEYCADLSTLCESCDIISVHVPLLDETMGMFNADIFAKMKPGTIFINTSRGEVHDEAALLKAVKEDGLRVGLDVFDGEPNAKQGAFQAEITQQEGFVGTPHIGASTTQSQLSVASEAIRVVRTFLEEGELLNCVNMQKPSRENHQMVVRHFDKVGVLAAILNVLQKADLNIQDMNNSIFQGGKAAVATISLSAHPGDDVVKELEALEDKVIQVTVTGR